jgi:hypothetical protein
MKILVATLSGFALLLTLACSSDGGPTVPPTIISQPVSQSVAAGQQATFTVQATDGPLSFQWYWNGVAVNNGGVPSASFTTPVTVPADNQSTFTVSVTNPVGTVTSATAILTVPGSPLPPKAGDLRFKDIDAFPLQLAGVEITNMFGGETLTINPNFMGTPISLGSPGPTSPVEPGDSMDWSYLLFQLPTGAPGRTTIYQSDTLEDFQSDISAFRTNTIIASLDLFSYQDIYALEAIQTSAAEGYSFRGGYLLPGDLQTVASQEGALSRVITAVSLNAGQAYYASYGWQGDTTTIYETSVATATSSTVGTSATEMAQQGYIITALGGNDTDGFLLVGTRVQGQTTPRLLTVGDWFNSFPARGYACMGMYDLSVLFEQ